MKTYLMLGNCQSLRWRHYILLFIWNLCQTLNTGKLKVFNIYFPSQNTQPGAEEAFKILGHAFELIGEPVSLCCLKKVLHLIKNIDIFKISTGIQKQRCSELIYMYLQGNVMMYIQYFCKIPYYWNDVLIMI